jgi:hypothetical protein
MCTAVFAPKIALLTSPAAFSAGMESQGDKRRAGQGTRARAEKDQLAQRKAERRALAAVLSGENWPSYSSDEVRCCLQVLW